MVLSTEAEGWSLEGLGWRLGLRAAGGRGVVAGAEVGREV